ncbi:MAG: hypothetical protein KDA61_17150 [Planctomycetales bacterium]|nr:hypothetical protein [Planctomycetales bacterium]
MRFRVFLHLAVTTWTVLGGPVVAAPQSAPPAQILDGGNVQILGKPSTPLAIGDVSGDWTLMAVATTATGQDVAVFEDFTSQTGAIAFVGADGARIVFSKSREPVFAEAETLYRGHSLASVLASDDDLLGQEILSRPGDPNYDDVAACFAPIPATNIHTFLGTPDCATKVPVSSGGRTPDFDPAILAPEIRPLVNANRVHVGSVGGWLPALRFVYRTSDDSWVEFVAFAPFRVTNQNSRVQPVWYRVCSIHKGELQWVKYVDSFLPSSSQSLRAKPTDFYTDLLAFRER